MDARTGTHQQNQGSAAQSRRSAPSEPYTSTSPGGNTAESSTRASMEKQTKAVSSGYHNYTHFVSIPLTHPALVDKLDDFKKKITEDLKIHDSLFNKTKSLHLTVRMLELRGEERIRKAAEVLQSVSPKVMKVLEDQPISIRLKGLALMRGSVDKAFVVYAPVVSGEEQLLSVCKVIIDALTDAGLIPQNYTEHNLKLHVTLMNAAFKKRANRHDKVVPFDARGIFELYGSEEWGEYAIEEAHLSQRHSFDPNGYYRCCASIPFPQVR